MRKSIFLAGLLAICAGAVQAQKGYSAGLKAGANFYNLKSEGSGGFDYKTRTAPNGGMFFHVPIAAGFSIQPEIMYSGEGAKYDDAVAKTSNTIRLQYVNVPVMFQYNTSVGFYVEAGPQLGVLVQGKQLIDNNGAKSDLDLLSKSYKITAISVGGGIGYRMGMYGINARYNKGLSNLSKVEGADKLTSSGFQVGLTVQFKQ